MRKVRVFCKELNDSGYIVLDRSNIHYISDVLRCSSGDEIEVLTGDSKLYRGRLTVEGKKYLIKDLVMLEVQRENIPVINLYIGVIKGSCFDYAIEKASEIGAASVTPVYCEYSRAGKISAEKHKRFVNI
ncbi:MAG: 16S rRNA (uracil(1498)-N(3))-methyltransferase, partial [Deltaproteobacteria bacterium]|nr:16S rRNA (uracil(1498)-N(3))-methyltransferase [Deltaproteobacteria bacterium]